MDTVKKRSPQCNTADEVSLRLLLASFRRCCAASLELLDSAGGIHDLFLTSVERMTGARDIDVRKWVLLAVSPGVCLARFDGRTDQKTLVVRVILENDQTIIIWVNIFFHAYYFGDLRSPTFESAYYTKIAWFDKPKDHLRSTRMLPALLTKRTIGSLLFQNIDLALDPFSMFHYPISIERI